MTEEISLLRGRYQLPISYETVISAIITCMYLLVGLSPMVEGAADRVNFIVKEYSEDDILEAVLEEGIASLSCKLNKL